MMLVVTITRPTLAKKLRRVIGKKIFTTILEERLEGLTV